MIVKADDTADEVAQIIHDPGVEGLASNEVFTGWTTDPNYTAETQLLTIEQVREAAMAKADQITSDESVTYYAATALRYKINYVDEAGVSQGTETVEAPGNSATGEAAYTVNMGYTPDSSERAFEGWLVAEGKSNVVGYEEGPSRATSSSASASPTAAGSSSRRTARARPTTPRSSSSPATPPPSRATTPRWCATATPSAAGTPTPPARPATSSPSGTPSASPPRSTPSGPPTPTRATPSSSGSRTSRATATTSRRPQQGNGNNAYARINGTNKQYTGFHLDNFDQNVTIATEGNAVVNVYYDRTQYTLTFRGTGLRPATYKTITALYGQYIGDNFPITTNGASSDWRWKPQSSSTFKQVLVYIDVMPAENVTFVRDTASHGVKYMEFYVEALPGQTAERTWNGKGFVKYGNTIPANYGFFTEAEDFVELTGYNKYGSDPAFNSSGRADVANGGTLSLYYTRQAFSINYMDGLCVDGNNNTLDETNLGQLGEVNGIAYGADISSRNKGGADFFEPTREGFAFEGWYSDPECTHPYDFNKMPDGGVTVYAKWRQVQYRVFLHPNAGTQQSDPSLDWGSASQAMNFRVSA